MGRRGPGHGGAEVQNRRDDDWKQLEAILLMPRKDWIEDYGFWNVEEELHD